MRFLNGSEYFGASLRFSGAILSHSFDTYRAFEGQGVDLGAVRDPHVAAVLTKSGEYMRTFLLTLSNLTVRAPLRDCGMASFLESVRK